MAAVETEKPAFGVTVILPAPYSRTMRSLREDLPGRMRVPVVTGGGFGAIDVDRTEERDEFGFVVYR